MFSFLVHLRLRGLSLNFPFHKQVPTYILQVETNLGPTLFPLIYIYEVKKVTKVTSNATTSASPQQTPAINSAASHSHDDHPHELIRQLRLSQDKGQGKLFSEEFRLRGCNMREEFQTTLESCRTHMLNKEIIPVRLQRESTNAADIQAIVFQVQVPGNNLWKSVGYVGAEKIPKVNAALDNQEITDFVMDIPTYGQGAKKPGYFSHVTVTKKNKWLPNDPNNTYKKP